MKIWNNKVRAEKNKVRELSKFADCELHIFQSKVLHHNNATAMEVQSHCKSLSCVGFPGGVAH